MSSILSDVAKMRLALDQAMLAALDGEIPVGAAIFKGDQCIAVGRNAPIASSDPTAHAEVVALREAARVLGNYRLEDCELFVTLEPCAMCSGAILQARLSRLVFGASEPKTGAAGSIINLFDHAALNHQTQVNGGVLAQECSSELQQFFQLRRQAQALERITRHPLREDALRTPDAAFSDLPDYLWPPNYLSDLPSLRGLRMHYLDVGPRDSSSTYLCLHDDPAWSYVFRHQIRTLTGEGQRVVAPDLIGFGKSDKPKKESAHRFDWHQQVVLELIDRLGLKNIVLVVMEGSGILGRALQMAAPDRFVGLLEAQPKPATAFDRAADAAPFPDAGHRAAIRAFRAWMPRHAAAVLVKSPPAPT